MNKPGKPKVYWLAYKPPGDSGENQNIYSRQTSSHSKGFGENKPAAPNGDLWHDRATELEKEL
jgi:hypothetical protein